LAILTVADTTPEITGMRVTISMVESGEAKKGNGTSWNVGCADEARVSLSFLQNGLIGCA
jgi:hypothetical protein